ncbi:10109_t:CDS:2 [Rhizophagus irregularis]|nr:10109_t:CDS:2 [Rhizophagus irregularis]
MSDIVELNGGCTDRLILYGFAKLIKELIKRSICEYEQQLIEHNKNDELDILKRYKRYWELLRGAYNDNFNKIAKEKNTKNVVENLWIFIRKDEEEKNEIDGDDEANKEKLGKNGKTYENEKNQKNLAKKIKLVTKDRLIVSWIS